MPQADLTPAGVEAAVVTQAGGRAFKGKGGAANHLLPSCHLPPALSSRRGNHKKQDFMPSVMPGEIRNK